MTLSVGIHYCLKKYGQYNFVRIHSTPDYGFDAIKKKTLHELNRDFLNTSVCYIGCSHSLLM